MNFIKFVCMHLYVACCIHTWRQPLTNRQLYGNLPPVSSVIQVRRLQFAGHCYRSKNEVVNRVILWEPKHGRRSRGRRAKNYIDILAVDACARSSELLDLMENREQWKTIINSASSTLGRVLVEYACMHAKTIYNLLILIHFVI